MDTIDVRSTHEVDCWEAGAVVACGDGVSICDDCYGCWMVEGCGGWTRRACSITDEHLLFRLAFATCVGDKIESGRLKGLLTSIQLEMLSLTT